MIINLAHVLRELRRPERPFVNTFMSVDGNNCPINEPKPSSRTWFSNKLNRSGLRYEVVVSISSCELVWVTWTFNCLSYSNLKVFNRYLFTILGQNESVLTDLRYDIPRSLLKPDLTDPIECKIHSYILSKHENVHAIFNTSNFLSSRFRHIQYLYSFCFHFVANIVQVMLKYDHPLRRFQIVN